MRFVVFDELFQATFVSEFWRRSAAGCLVDAGMGHEDSALIREHFNGFKSFT